MAPLARGLLVSLLLVALTLGLRLPARANDAAALIGGLVAGALVYEALDDDGPSCHGYYSAPPRDYRPHSEYYYWGPPWGAEFWYHQPSYQPDYYYRPNGYVYREGPYDYGRQSFRAPSHARRNVGPPPLYRHDPPPRYGRQYEPPRRPYRK